MMKTVSILALLALVSLDGFAQEYTRWSLPEGAKLRMGKGRLNEIKYSQVGKRLAVAGSLGIWLYDTSSLHETNFLAVQQSGVSSVAFSSDGKMIASGSWDGGVKLWDAKTGKLRQSLAGHIPT